MATTGTSRREPGTRPDAIEARADGRLHLHLKVVPGASKDALAGAYGDRLKVRVAAPAESGKANKAVLALLATALELAPAQLTLVRGAGMPRKTIAVAGITRAEAAVRLGLEPA